MMSNLLFPYRKRIKAKYFVFILFISIFSLQTTYAQEIRPPQQQQIEQRIIDERLAFEFYNSQDWENAGILYLKLYESTNTLYYYNYYFNCLIRLNKLDDAEKAIKKQQRNGYNVQNEVDQGYILQLKGDQRKSKNVCEKLINEMPGDRNIINQIANAFMIRNMMDYALQTYEIGTEIPGVNYGFHLEKANLYQTTGNYEATIDTYLSYLLIQPDNIDLIKNRLQYILMMDIDNSVADLMRNKLLRAAQSNPDKAIFGELLIWFSLQQKDYDIAMIQALAMDRRFGERDFNILDLSEISLSNGQYEVATKGFSYIINKGSKSIYYFQAVIGSLQARYLLANEKQLTDNSVYQAISQDIDKAFNLIGFNRETYKLAIIQAGLLTYRLNKPEAARELIDKALQLPLQQGELAELKLQLADILLFQDDVWEATLLYSQIEKALKNEPIAHEARFRNARLRYFIGEFSWAETQLDVLKAATSKLIANDAISLSMLIRDNLMDDTTGISLKAYAKADLLTYQQKDQLASNLLDSLSKNTNSLVLKPHIYMKTAEIAIRNNQFALADSLYKLVYTGFADGYLADDALFKSANLNETQLKNIQAAQTLFEYIFDKYPASIYAAQARQKYRILRGDTL